MTQQDRMLEDAIDACNYLHCESCQEMTMEEMYGDGPPTPWLELLNRMGEKKVEKVIGKLMTVQMAYDAYYEITYDTPPGVGV